MKRLLRSNGYTLIELIVVILIVGILAAYGVPQYLRSVEVGRADDAVALVNMIGTTNRMFAMDHNNVFASGAFPSAAGAGGCGAGACPVVGPYAACALVYCRYLADQDFGVKLYTFSACDGGACAGQAGTFVSGATREAPASAPYDTWALTMDLNGRITAYGTAPPTPTY